MGYYCDVCDKPIKPKSKYKYLKSNSHREFDKCKHIIISLRDNGINIVDEAFSLYVIEHNIKFEYYLENCQIN